MARRLGVPVARSEWSLKLTFGPEGHKLEITHPDLEREDARSRRREKR